MEVSSTSAPSRATLPGCAVPVKQSFGHSHEHVLRSPVSGEVSVARVGYRTGKLCHAQSIPKRFRTTVVFGSSGGQKPKRGSLGIPIPGNASGKSDSSDPSDPSFRWLKSWLAKLLPTEILLLSVKIVSTRQLIRRGGAARPFPRLRYRDGGRAIRSRPGERSATADQPDGASSVRF
jgi:hypothetical protein